MIGIKMATWLLVVQLHSPTQPMEEQLWNMRYTKIPTAEYCENMAKEIWAKYHARYAQTMTPWFQSFDTTCSATTPHEEYTWFIKCDQYQNCETRKYEGKRR